MRRKYTRQEVLPLLEALDRQVREAMKLATDAERDASRHSFATYRQFRDKVGEFQACVILIDTRLKSLTDRKEDLEEQFERLDLLMLALLIRASMRFFYVLSSNPILPLGARELFVSELRSLHEAHERLRREEYAERISPELERDLERAKQILEEIIDKAPGLLRL